MFKPTEVSMEFCTIGGFSEWLISANPGASIVYQTAHLKSEDPARMTVSDARELAGMASKGIDGARLAAAQSIAEVADTVLSAYETGHVELVQRRWAVGRETVLEYVAIKRNDVRAVPFNCTRAYLALR